VTWDHLRDVAHSVCGRGPAEVCYRRILLKKSASKIFEKHSFLAKLDDASLIQSAHPSRIIITQDRPEGALGRLFQQNRRISATEGTEVNDGSPPSCCHST
jgi:hypothetical protein